MKKLTNKQKAGSTLLERPAEVAAYFGFSAIASPTIGKEDVQATKFYKKTGYEMDWKEDIYEAEEKARLLRLYLVDSEGYPQHYFLFYRKPLHGGSVKRRTFRYECGLEIFGASKGIAEAILIQTALSILSEEGFSDLQISVNSVGDKESISQLERELTVYYRKNIERFSSVCRHMFKRDVFEILRSENEECRAVVEDAPRSVSLLSETARVHFTDVLEYIENTGTPYIIDNHLVLNPLYASHTIFEIQGKSKTGKRIVCALGYRYNHMAKKIGMKKEVPAVGITIFFKRNGKMALRRMPKPKFYLIHIGPAAKLKSLAVIEILRKARIPIFHALTKDKYTGQAATAENMKVPFVLIIGQKEAIENTVVVRDVKTRFQDTVPINGLVTYLKKLNI